MHIHVTDEVTPYVDKAVERTTDFTPVLLGPVAESIRQSFRAQFATEGSYFGTPWEPLAAATVRKKHGNSVEILVGPNEELEQSLTQEGSPFSVAEMDSGELVFGTEVPYAYMLHHGTKHMPGRSLVPDEWPAADTAYWAELLGDYVTEGVVRAR